MVAVIGSRDMSARLEHSTVGVVRVDGGTINVVADDTQLVICKARTGYRSCRAQGELKMTIVKNRDRGSHCNFLT